VIDRIANGLVALSQSIKTDGIESLINGYHTGFITNMLRKLDDVYEKSDGR